MSTAIQIEKLIKTYPGNEEPVLKGIHLQIEKGEIFGLMGPNGAGKTTLLSILSGLKKPDFGSLHVSGLCYSTDAEKIRQKIGVVPQDIALYPTLSARENLMFFGNCGGISGTVLKDKINTYLDRFGMSKSADRRLSTYSGGMKRRINLLAGLLHDPEILFLDEPTVGIDVQSRHVITDFLKEYNETTGITIIYTSHHMKEAESLCSRLAIMDNGEIIVCGKPGDLIDMHAEGGTLEQVFLNLTGHELRD